MPDYRALILAGLLCSAAVPAPAVSQASIVVLVRHAEKADTSADPILSPRGLARAESLAEALRDLRPGAILVTQYRRTQLTAAPSAARFGVTPQVIGTARDLTTHAEAVAQAVRAASRGSAVLVVGHSNTLGPIIQALGGPALPQICEAVYTTLYLLALDRDGGPPRLLRSAYGEPDRVGPSECAQLGP